MKVKTDLKSGTLAETASSTLNAAAGNTAKFVNRASGQATSLVSTMSDKAAGLWNALWS